MRSYAAWITSDLLHQIGLLPCLGQGVEPFRSAAGGQVTRQLRTHDLQFSAEMRHPGEVFLVVETRRGMLQGDLGHLTFETGAIHRHGTFARRQHGGDPGAHGVVGTELLGAANPVRRPSGAVHRFDDEAVARNGLWRVAGRLERCLEREQVINRQRQRPLIWLVGAA